MLPIRPPVTTPCAASFIFLSGTVCGGSNPAHLWCASDPFSYASQAQASARTSAWASTCMSCNALPYGVANWWHAFQGVILYGEPGTGKTLLAKAVANSTSATFLRVVGSELIQKYLGDGPKLVRELFRVADDLAPSIVFIGQCALLVLSHIIYERRESRSAQSNVGVCWMNASSKLWLCRSGSYFTPSGQMQAYCNSMTCTVRSLSSGCTSDGYIFLLTIHCLPSMLV